MSRDQSSTGSEVQPPGNRLRDLFLEAMTRQGDEERRQYLAKACGDDHASHALVTSLLEAHEQAGEFLEHTAMGGPSELLSEGLGTVIGRYKLIEKIGEGGFGTVYMAEQTEPVRRRVAVKVIKLGMDTRQVIARFEAERQALALMDHPNIAKVLDAAATDTGRPYFVMELVRGVKLTEYCDRNRLGLGERLALFIQVCNAIQHAHEKGVIHRDLKPSNILVTLPDGPASAGVPKVIDFGIAKAVAQKLTEKTLFTECQTMVGTPAYISPEQSEMSSVAIDTRTDIYSLGVLLYELLTGTTPFSGEELLRSGLDEMRKTIREEEPVRPSTRLAQELAPAGGPASGEWARGTERRAAKETRPEDGTPSEAKRSPQAIRGLIRLLQGDLDCIVLKCLEKDKARRYDTAHGLAMDLQRFLRHEAILARPPSTAYRVRQTFRRHRFGVASAAAVTAALLIGLVATTLQGLRARDAWFRERRNAYAAEVNVAFQALAENDLGRARELLERQRPHPGEEDLRGFEWRYLWKLCRGDEVESFTDPAANAVAFSPDGRVFAYGSSEVTVRETASRRVLAKLKDRGGGPQNRFFGGELGIRTLCFSPDGRTLASAQDSGTVLWDTSTWQKVRILPGTAIPTEFSPDGRWLMTGTTNGLRLWNTRTWEGLGEVAAPAASQFINRYNSAFSPDSRALVTVGRSAGQGARSLVLWQVPELQILAELNLPGAAVGSVRFSADGKYLFAGKWDGELALLNMTSSQPVATRREHTGWIRGVAIAGDGKSVVTASSDRTVNIWDAAPFSLRTRLRGHVGEVRSIALAPGGTDLLSASTDGTTKLWRTETRHDESDLNGASIVAGFLPDGTVVGASRDRIVQWNPLTAAQDATVIGKDALAPAAGSTSIALARRLEKTFAAISKPDGTIELWDLNEGTRVQQWEAHGAPTTAVAFTPDMGLVASGSSAGEVKIWDPATKQLVLQLEGIEGAIRGLNFSTDGRTLAACGDSSRVFAWQVATGGRCFVSGAHGGPETVIDSVSFSPDGELLAATTLQSNETHLWELRSGRRRHVLKGHIQGVKAAAFSPDNRTLATASGDRKVKLWNVATGQQLAAFALPERCISVAFSPDGNLLAVGCSPGAGAGFIRVWRAPAILEIEASK